MVPETVRLKAAAEGALDWLERLPSLVAELADEWCFSLGGVCSGGTEAYVAEVTLAAGVPAVLKVPIPRPGMSGEVTVLRLAGGTGCVRLLRYDEGRGALLLERLGPSLSDLGLPLRRRHEILCAVAARLWRPAPGCGLTTGADKGSWLSKSIVDMWESLGRPCTRAAVDHALACAAHRIAAHDDARAVLVHGDVHQWNTLRDGDGFSLIDPDGLLADAEYDLGIIMREDPADLLHGDPTARARWLAARTGRDPVAIWEWGAVERVSTGLLCLADGLETGGRLMLAAADRIAHWYPIID